jgi:holo-[acyl-carrier protein] synthase
MEIVGIGTDIVECHRIGRMIEQHGELFLRRVYTEREIRYCQERKRALEHFAALWAAKEAILKSLGTAWRRGISWTEMEIRNDPGGRPQVLLCGAAKDLAQGMRIADVLLSIAHCRAYATAYVIAVRNPPAGG